MAYRRFGSGEYFANEKHMVITTPVHESDRYMCIVLHGALDNGWTYGSPIVHKDLQLLADTGVVVVAADVGGTLTWYNDLSIGRIDTLIAWMVTNYGVRTDKIIFIGDSMGGGLALNWCWRHPDQVGACVLRVPGVGLNLMHARNTLGLAASMEAAYTDLAGFNAALPTHDPSHANNTALISPISSRFRIWYSVDDPAIFRSDVFSYASATGVQITSLGNVGHTPTLIYPAVDHAAEVAWIWNTLRSAT